MSSNLPDVQTAGEPVPALGMRSGPDTPTPRAVSALWYRLVDLRWRTLALVAPGNDARAWRLAQGLVEVANDRPGPLKAVNALGANLGRLAAVADLLSHEKLQTTRDATRFIVATDSPLENPASIGLLSNCDAVVLLLERGRTRIPDGQRILELVGPERFIGAVLGSW